MNKKYILSGAVILAFIAFIAYEYPKSTAPKSPATVQTAQTAQTPPTTTTAGSTPPPQSSSVAYKDGSYTGKVADAYFGNVQVKATITNGKLADVEFLQYPNDRPASTRISNNAMPILKSEAIAAQSSQVDIVSGATQTWQAFEDSLGDALNQAKS